MSTRLYRHIAYKTKGEIIEEKLQKAYFLLSTKKYLNLKENSPQRNLCEGVGLYLNKQYSKGRTRVFESLHILTQNSYQEVAERILNALKNRQTSLFSTFHK